MVAPTAVPSPVQDQAVHLRDDTGWRRGCVLAVRANTRLVKLVEGRGTVELGRAELYQMHEEVAAVPVLTADCMLAGAGQAEQCWPHWGETARKDWVRLLEGRELRLLWWSTGWARRVPASAMPSPASSRGARAIINQKWMRSSE